MMTIDDEVGGGFIIKTWFLKPYYYYLQVPVDAPSTVRIEHCIKAQYVLHRMQFRETKLNLLLLDMCREFNNVGGVPGDIQPVKSRGNTAIGYAW